MRNTLVALALGGLLAVSSAPSLFAQDNTPPPQNSGQSDAGQSDAGQQGPGGRHRMDPDAQLQRMTARLNLTSDQQSQIRPILVDRQQKMQALWQNQSLSREDRRSQMMAIRSDSNAKIEAVLNDQQKQQFEAMQQHRGRRGQNGGGDGGDAQPQ